MAPSPDWHIYNTTPAPRLGETSRKRGWEDCNSQRNGKSAVRLCLLNVREPTPMKSQPHGCLNKNKTNRQDNMEGVTHRVPALDKELQATKES